MKTEKIQLSQVKLTPYQKRIVTQETPPEFIKSRKGKGGKTFSYVEGGYVVARLNEAFSPVGWEFDVVEQGTYETKDGIVREVWVKGKLTVVDHKNGYRVSKVQFGSKKHYGDKSDDNLLGDTYKAATTDCLKKCASFFGVALDVYWAGHDEGEDAPKPPKSPAGPPPPAKSDKVKKADVLKGMLEKIKAETDIQLLAQWRKKVEDSAVWKAPEKLAIGMAIENKINALKKTTKNS